MKDYKNCIKRKEKLEENIRDESQSASGVQFLGTITKSVCIECSLLLVSIKHNKDKDAKKSQRTKHSKQTLQQNESESNLDKLFSYINLIHSTLSNGLSVFVDESRRTIQIFSSLNFPLAAMFLPKLLALRLFSLLTLLTTYF